MVDLGTGAVADTIMAGIATGVTTRMVVVIAETATAGIVAVMGTVIMADTRLRVIRISGGQIAGM